MQILWLPEVNPSLLITTSLTWITLLLSSFVYHKLRTVVFVLTGFLYTLVFCYIQLQEQLKTPANLNLTVRIDSLPKTTQQKTSFIASEVNTGQRFLLNQYHNSIAQTTFKAGNTYEMNVNMKPPYGSVNGVGFDREKWLFRNAINGIGTIKTVSDEVGKSNDLRSHINRWRTSLSGLINTYFTSPKANALIHALSIGEKSHFEHQDTIMFQNTGTAHLIAISGLHIGMVAFVGWLLGGLLFKAFPQQRLTAPVIQILSGLVLASLYACLAGMAVSTLRALVMLTIYGVYKMLRRSSYAWDVWSISLILVLLFDPLNVLDGGFWLSFTAVAILILTFSGSNKNQSNVITFMAMQWTLLIGMLPISLAIFSRVNILAPAINLIMIPLMTFLLIPLILLMITIGSFTQSLPNFLVHTINWICESTIQLLSWFNQFTAWTLELSIQNSWQLLLLILGAILMVLPRPIPQRYLGLIFILLAFYTPKIEFPKGHYKVDVLDVGQGLSIVIQTQNHTLIYDVGATHESGFNMVDAVILPYLKQQNIKAIDTLVLSHQDNDHSGAAPYLLKQLVVHETLGTEPEQQPCIKGKSWTWDGVNFMVISPYNLQPYLKNNSSCVIKVSSIESSFLLTGDIEHPVEYRLTKIESDLIQSDVLLLPHHGSNTSSTLEFIQAVNPTTAINSSGQYNPFNHPTNKVKSRYQQLGIPIIDTQDSGLITMHTYPEFKITAYRNLHPRIWRKKKPE